MQRVLLYMTSHKDGQNIRTLFCDECVTEHLVSYRQKKQRRAKMKKVLMKIVKFFESMSDEYNSALCQYDMDMDRYAWCLKTATTRR